jgi:hypothetical protein
MRVELLCGGSEFRRYLQVSSEVCLIFSAFACVNLEARANLKFGNHQIGMYKKLTKIANNPRKFQVWKMRADDLSFIVNFTMFSNAFMIPVSRSENSVLFLPLHTMNAYGNLLAPGQQAPV